MDALRISSFIHRWQLTWSLQHEADPTVRNLKDESPLDLAAQYGRLETVQLLVDTDPSLLRNVTTRHSPLHLAARNGHRNVAKVLLDGGFDVNYVVSIYYVLYALTYKISIQVCILTKQFPLIFNVWGDNSSLWSSCQGNCNRTAWSLWGFNAEKFLRNISKLTGFIENDFRHEWWKIHLLVYMNLL